MISIFVLSSRWSGHEPAVDLAELATGHLRVVCIRGDTCVLAEVVAAEDGLLSLALQADLLGKG